jgi:hypothetical protein
VAGAVNFIKSENMFYPACTLQFNGRMCHKKLQEAGDNTW